MISRKESEVIIIGAGIGGLIAGAILTKKGYKIKIFEKEQLLGGRALSFDASSINLQEYKKLLSSYNMKIHYSEPDLTKIFTKKMLKGYQLDLGYHAIGGGTVSNINNVLYELDDHVNIIESYIGLIEKDGFDFPFLSRLDKLRILPKICRLLFTDEKKLKQFDKISMNETIKKYGKGKMKLILEVFSRSITTINNLDLISTGEMFRAQKNLLKGSKPVGYPLGGLSSITKKLANYILINNGEIHLGETVKKIIIRNNKVRGVIVNDKKYFSDIVVSNILVKDFFKIADEKHFSKQYVKNIKSLSGTGSLCAYYSLEKIDPFLLGKTFHFIERNVGVDGNDVVGMIDFMCSSPNSGIAPQSKFVVQSYAICTPKEAKNKQILDKLRHLLDKKLEILIPGFKKNQNWAIYNSIWHLDGVAKTIKNDKPEIKTPIENLYFIGDCVKAPGIGLNCAINSARILTSLIEKH